MTNKVLVDVRKLVVVTDNHGGYLAGRCLVCDAGGWLDGDLGYSYTVKHDMVKANRLQHKKMCPVNQYALKVFRND